MPISLARSGGSDSLRCSRSSTAHRSDGSGRSIPGILTKPPNGTTPIPYSVSPTCFRASGGGNPT